MWYLNEWILLTLLTLTNGYDRKCPHSTQWNFTSRSYGCSDHNVYLCLFDRLKSNAANIVFKETCGHEDLSREGFKYILTPDLYQVPCASKNYQPFTFTTNGNSHCVLSKSLCNASGQILANNGSSSTDIGCRCDYRQNFDYVIPPKDPCLCKPAEEDCSCYIRKCDDSKEMIADYRCLKRVEAILPEDIKCPIISRAIPPKETDTVYKIKLQPVSSSRTWSSQASVIVIVIVITYTVLIGFLFFSVPNVKNILQKSKLFFKIKENDFMVLKEENVTITCNVKSCLPVHSVTWKKEGNSDSIQIIQSEGKYEIVCGKNPYLKIIHFNADDEGKYICIVRNAIGLSNASFSSCMNHMSSVGWLTRFVKVLQHIPVFHAEAVTLRSYDIGSQSKPSVYNVHKGNAISMEPCWGGEQKLQKVKWFRGSNERTKLDLTNDHYSGGATDAPSLTIKKTTLEDKGEYFCIQLNNDGKTQMSSFKLKIIPQEEIYEALLEHREDKTFLRPEICDTIDKHLQKYKIVVITGREGTGKSKLSLELASIYNEKGFVIMKVDLLENHAINTNFDDVLLIIDDKEYTSDSLNAFMKHRLLDFNDRDIKVVLTCSNLDLDTVRSILEQWELKDEIFVDINRCLKVEEKEIILKRYLKANNIATSASSESNFKDPQILTDRSVKVTLDDEAIKVIKNEEPWKGFPLCAALFSSDRKFLHLGEKYFINPPSGLIEELKELYKTARGNSDCIDTINEYCILVYIMNNSDHHLDLNKHNLCKQFDELYQTLFQFKYTSQQRSNEDKKTAIENTLHRMNNKYLRFQGGVYTFIHPCLSIAMFLSSDYMVHYLLQKGSLFDITEFVRSKDYTALENELVIEIDTDYHHILGERLVRHAFENRDVLLHVTQYIYKYWRSSNNEIVNMIFSHIEFILFQSFGVKTHFLQPLDGEDNSENSIKVENQVSLSNIIMLVDELTYKGRNPWIYGNGTTDFLILSGLVTAATNRYATNRKETFDILLLEVQNRIHSQSFVQLLSKPLDICRNTFFHFLMIFSQKEASQIVSLIKGEKSILDVQNVKKFTPLDIAAYLGKSSVLAVVDFKTNCTKNVRDRLQRLARSGNIEFCHGNSNNKIYDQPMVNETTDDGAAHEKLQTEYADDEKQVVINESKKKKGLMKKTSSRSKDKHDKTEKRDKIKCELEFIDILFFEDASMLNIVDFGKMEDYQACINLLS